jgi:hypothetical protein
MRLAVLAVSALLLVGAGLPASATPCRQQVSALQRRLDSIGAVRIAGLQPGHTLATGSLKALPRAGTEPPSDPQAVPSRENVAAARLLIQEALAEDQDGNQRACENILTDAKRLIGALP